MLVLTMRHNNAVPSDVSPSYYFLPHLSSTLTYLTYNQRGNVNFKFALRYVGLMNTRRNNERKKTVNNEMSSAYNIVSSSATFYDNEN